MCFCNSVNKWVAQSMGTTGVGKRGQTLPPSEQIQMSARKVEDVSYPASNAKG